MLSHDDHGHSDDYTNALLSPPSVPSSSNSPVHHNHNESNHAYSAHAAISSSRSPSNRVQRTSPNFKKEGEEISSEIEAFVQNYQVHNQTVVDEANRGKSPRMKFKDPQHVKTQLRVRTGNLSKHSPSYTHGDRSKWSQSRPWSPSGRYSCAHSYASHRCLGAYCSLFHFTSSFLPNIERIYPLNLSAIRLSRPISGDTEYAV